MQLTANFTESEVFASRKAQSLKIDNEPPPELREVILRNAKMLAEMILQPVRNRWGKVVIQSWYRSPALNEAVGGAASSQHLEAKAADIVCPAVINLFGVYVWLWRSLLPYDQIIYEQTWIHLSCDPDKPEQRREPLVAYGKGLYKAFSPGMV